jgi:MraZ protein
MTAAQAAGERAGERLMFTGQYRHSIDVKGRVAIPARFRLPLEEGAVAVKWAENCIGLYPRAAYEQLAGTLAGLPLNDEKGRKFARFVFGNSFDVEADAQGRILLALSLRDWAGLTGEAVMVGARDHVEIWAPGRWADFEENMESGDALTALLAGLTV